MVGVDHFQAFMESGILLFSVVSHVNMLFMVTSISGSFSVNSAIPYPFLFNPFTDDSFKS